MIHAANDLWPLIYVGRCKCVPLPYTEMIQIGPNEIVGTASTRREEVFVYRVTYTLVLGLTEEDAKACGFLHTAALLDYLRNLYTGLCDENVVVLAHFERTR